MDPQPQPESFHWSECAERLRALLAEGSLSLEADGEFFEGPGLRVVPPLVYPWRKPAAGARPYGGSAAESAARRAGAGSADAFAQYLAGLPVEPGLHCLILLQAGAASLGMFEGGEALTTKTLKRYVVRGKGKAQPGYLAAKGKSRYGSRLRLQNARLLVDEVNAKLHEYWDEFGTPEQIFVNAPKRLWPDLWRGKEHPPFDQDAATVRVPLDLPVPTTDVLLRTYKSLCYGRILRP
ncbi:MAG: hypothetical protein ACI8QC_002445 [Planctomycetota bacterium]|jgi:hypothetical protein